ncbi:uncharacterized protein LOC100375197 [Saccoglossus kowalevskii]|uniref:Uncharacterized protein LOC100375197 n=1 Tax=Saccoglossus kowalevskii TaxID=10224 RepID=A0ABM0GI92_SACKO|nr:PREDICTED: uncharacterized protein LOC100375197 [Saccoglossus kowalevskii]
MVRQYCVIFFLIVTLLQQQPVEGQFDGKLRSDSVDENKVDEPLSDMHGHKDEVSDLSQTRGHGNKMPNMDKMSGKQDMMDVEHGGGVHEPTMGMMQESHNNMTFSHAHARHGLRDKDMQMIQDDSNKHGTGDTATVMPGHQMQAHVSQQHVDNDSTYCVLIGTVIATCILLAVNVTLFCFIKRINEKTQKKDIEVQVHVLQHSAERSALLNTAPSVVNTFTGSHQQPFTQIHQGCPCHSQKPCAQDCIVHCGCNPDVSTPTTWKNYSNKRIFTNTVERETIL